MSEGKSRPSIVPVEAESPTVTRESPSRSWDNLKTPITPYTPQSPSSASRKVVGTKVESALRGLASKTREKRAGKSTDVKAELEYLYKVIEEKDNDLQLAAELGQMLMQKGNEAVAQADHYKAQAEAAQARLNQVIEMTEKDREDADRALEDSRSLERKYAQATETISRLEREMNSGQRRIAEYEVEVGCLEDRLEAVTQELNLERSSSQRARARTVQLEEAFKETSEQASASVESQAEEYRKEKQKNMKLCDDNQRLEDEIEKLKETLESITTARDELHKEVGRLKPLEASRKMLEQELEEAHETIAKVKGDADNAIREAVNLQNQLNDKESELESMQFKAERFEEEKADFEEQIRDMQEHMRNINLPTPTQPPSGTMLYDELRTAATATVEEETQRRKKSEEASQDAGDTFTMELFVMIVMAVKLSFVEMDEDLVEVSPIELYQQAIDNGVQFHEWYAWSRKRITQLYVQALYDQDEESGSLLRRASQVKQFV